MTASASLWFVVPAWRRVELARICLGHLADVCDKLAARGIDAAAVVIADDENLDTARELGFGTVERDNESLGRKFNDGFQFAAAEGVDYVVPFGTDNLIDEALIQIPTRGTIRSHRLASIVREDGKRIAHIRVPYEGGDGIRIIPTAMLAPLGYRPAAEEQRRAVDASIRDRLRRTMKAPQLRFEYHDLRPEQIVGFQSPDVQLTQYEPLVRHYGIAEMARPFGRLRSYYPAPVVDAVAALYQ